MLIETRLSGAVGLEIVHVAACHDDEQACHVSTSLRNGGDHPLRLELLTTFSVFEDVVAGVVWGAQLAWPGSWQLELYRRHDDLCVSGSLADREFGHWVHLLQPGESITSPEAVVTVTDGDVETLCDRFTQTQQRAARSQPSREFDLPIVFNDWCTTWGQTSHERLCRLADRLEGSGVTYLVVDAGWDVDPGGFWPAAFGDWVPSRLRFPGWALRLRCSPGP